MNPNWDKRSDFSYLDKIQTRWADNDVYGHINNVAYYAFFDTVINRMLINSGCLDLVTSEKIAVVVETQCRYFASLSYPQSIEIALAVEHIGNSSVVYRLGVYAEGSDVQAAQGKFVHVYVDRETRKAVSIPAEITEQLKSLGS